MKRRRPTPVDPECVELAALSSFTARIEQWYRELHQRHLASAQAD